MTISNTSIFFENEWTNDLKILTDLNKKALCSTEKERKEINFSNSITFDDWVQSSKIANQILQDPKKSRGGNSMMLKLIANFCLPSGSFPCIYHTHESQFYCKNREKISRVLICVTGHWHQLNMPIPIFHNIAWRYYDGIGYFFTRPKNFYNGEEDFIECQVNKLKKTYGIQVVDLIGSSAGGPIGLTFSENTINGKKLIASPSILNNDRCYSLFQKLDFAFLDKTKIIFSSINSIDLEQYEFVKRTLPAFWFNKTIVDVAPFYNKHSTLVYAAQSGILMDFMKA